MWVAVLSPALLKERPGRFTYLAIPLCLLGVYLIAEAKTGDLGARHIRTIGIVVAVFQVVMFRGFSVLTRAAFCCSLSCWLHVAKYHVKDGGSASGLIGRAPGEFCGSWQLLICLLPACRRSSPARRRCASGSCGRRRRPT